MNKNKDEKPQATHNYKNFLTRRRDNQFKEKNIILRMRKS